MGFQCEFIEAFHGSVAIIFEFLMVLGEIVEGWKERSL